MKKEENTGVRAKAFRVIGELGFTDAQLVAILVETLTDENQFVKGHAIRALGKIGKPARQFISKLEKIRDDPEEDEAVRDTATYALRRLQRQ